MEERLHVRIVVHLARAAHALHDTALQQLLAIGKGRIFDASVAMKVQTRLGLAIAQRVIDRIQRQGRIPVSAQAPADDHARELVYHDRQIAPPAAHAQVGHVTDPDLVRKLPR